MTVQTKTSFHACKDTDCITNLSELNSCALMIATDNRWADQNKSSCRTTERALEFQHCSHVLARVAVKGNDLKSRVAYVKDTPLRLLRISVRAAVTASMVGRWKGSYSKHASTRDLRRSGTWLGLGHCTETQNTMFTACFVKEHDVRPHAMAGCTSADSHLKLLYCALKLPHVQQQDSIMLDVSAAGK